MAIGKVLNVLYNENLALTTPGGLVAPSVYTSSVFSVDQYALITLIVRVAGTVSGTTPTLTFAVQQSNDQVTWTQVGAALAAITAAGVQVTPYATGTTQGAITQTFVRVQATLGGTSPSFPNVFADLVFQAV